VKYHGIALILGEGKQSHGFTAPHKRSNAEKTMLKACTLIRR
ncbi:uncharacterized protein METZ01_LOCUS332295, partial [marine metagenome]